MDNYFYDGGNTPEQPQQPKLYALDASKCKSIKELGTLLNALGLAMAKEYAVEHGLEHLLIIEE